MLVCNVSLRPRGRAIAAELAEAGLAADAPGTGNVVFATLVDDPASVGETVDAYLGEIMLEAASAGDAATAVLVFTYDVSIAEAASAVDTQAGALAPAFATFDGVGVDVTLSNGNRTATHNATSSGGARSTANKSTGKFYFEITATSLGSNDAMVGILLSTGTYFQASSLGQNCVESDRLGEVWANNVLTSALIGNPITGHVVGFAIDLTARKVWLRRDAGNWNGDAAANPATGINGLIMAASGSFAPFVAFNASSGENVTLNCGQAAFANAAPSGFGNWTP